MVCVRPDASCGACSEIRRRVRSHSQAGANTDQRDVKWNRAGICPTRAECRRGRLRPDGTPKDAKLRPSETNPEGGIVQDRGGLKPYRQISRTADIMRCASYLRRLLIRRRSLIFLPIFFRYSVSSDFSVSLVCGS